MVAAMAGFALEDMFIKLAAGGGGGLGTGQILLMIALVGCPFFAAVAKAQGAAVITRDAVHPAMIWRNLGEVVGTIGFVTAITQTPLSSASAIAQAMPLAVTFGAAVVFGEAVGWRRWTAILVGFAGVIVILRPGLAAFEPKSLWAVLAVIGLSVRDLATRRVPARITSMQVSAWGFGAVGLLGAAMLAVQGNAAMPTSWQAACLAGAIIIGIASYWAIVAAMRVGEISAVTPFRYSRMVFALIIGVFIFDESPDLVTLLGTALIIASGLYTLWRERRLRRLTLSTKAVAL